MSMMITISLQQIRENSPCTAGWGKVLKSKGGKKADMGAQFPLTDVIESNGLGDALWCLRCRPEYSNLWRKYAVWCARQVESQMTDERSRSALDVAWRHSNGEATDAELAAARAAARDAWGDARDAAWAAWAAARAAADAAWDAVWDAAWDAAGASASASAAWDAARAAQKAKLIQILTAGEWVE